MAKEIEKTEEAKGPKAFWRKHKGKVKSFGKGIAIGGGLVAMFLAGAILGNASDGGNKDEEPEEEEEMDEAEEEEPEEED